jgi:hypothetical protein
MTMNLLRGVTISLVVFGTAIAAASCGKTEDGTDSNTHWWLRQCDDDSKCGGLSCICGVCSRECTAETCAEFGSDAVCAGSCSASSATFCIRGPQGTGGSQAAGGAVNTGGSRTTGGAGGSTPGSGGAGDIPDGPAKGPCAPMNAQDNPSFCGNDAAALPTLYYWDGRTCLPSTCCTGTDCGKRYETAEACDQAHSACYASDGIVRSCTMNEECILTNRTCCFCGLIGVNDVIAIQSDSERTWTGDSCAETQGACPPCVSIDDGSLSAVCVDGQCKTLDVTPFNACETHEDCVLREKTCCGCGRLGRDTLVSINVDSSQAYGAALCGTTTSLCDAVACEIGDPWVASCDLSVHRCQVQGKLQ